MGANGWLQQKKSPSNAEVHTEVRWIETQQTVKREWAFCVCTKALSILPTLLRKSVKRICYSEKKNEWFMLRANAWENIENGSIINSSIRILTTIHSNDAVASTGAYAAAVAALFSVLAEALAQILAQLCLCLHHLSCLVSTRLISSLTQSLQPSSF